MGYEWLERIVTLLTAAGIRAGEAYPSGQWIEVLSPVAAVELEGLDTAAGKAKLRVQILSPRILGGWCCQTTAAKAAAALGENGYRCDTGKMEYLDGSDCFCVPLTMEMALCRSGGVWSAGERWIFRCNDAELDGVTSFTAEQSRNRRVIGAFCQAEPVGVTPGSGGWTLKLVQTVDWEQQEPEPVAEPFVLTVTRENGCETYSGCYWNQVRLRHTADGYQIERTGFALNREVS